MSDFSILKFREEHNLSLNNDKGVFATHLLTFLKEDFKHTYLVKSDNVFKHINKLKELFILSDCIFFVDEIITLYDSSDSQNIIDVRTSSETTVLRKITNENIRLEYFKLDDKFLFNIRYNDKHVTSLPKLVNEYLEELIKEEIFTDFSLYRTDELFFTLQEFLYENNYIRDVEINENTTNLSSDNEESISSVEEVATFELVYPIEDIPSYVSVFINNYKTLMSFLEKEDFIERFKVLLECYNSYTSDGLSKLIIPESNIDANLKSTFTIYETLSPTEILHEVLSSNIDFISSKSLTKRERINTISSRTASLVFKKHLHFNIDNFTEKVKYDLTQYSNDEMIVLLDENNIAFRNNDIELDDFKSTIYPNLYYHE
jgi:hypothetical protein